MTTWAQDEYLWHHCIFMDEPFERIEDRHEKVFENMENNIKGDYSLKKLDGELIIFKERKKQIELTIPPVDQLGDYRYHEEEINYTIEANRYSYKERLKSLEDSYIREYYIEHILPNINKKDVNTYRSKSLVLEFTWKGFIERCFGWMI